MHQVRTHCLWVQIKNQFLSAASERYVHLWNIDHESTWSELLMFLWLLVVVVLLWLFCCWLSLLLDLLKLFGFFCLFLQMIWPSLQTRAIQLSQKENVQLVCHVCRPTHTFVLEEVLCFFLNLSRRNQAPTRRLAPTELVDEVNHLSVSKVTPFWGRTFFGCQK